MKKSGGGKASEVDMISKDGVDIISKLPDHILHLILSCIPSTEEVVRSGILSRRWRNLWTSVPSIDIDINGGWNTREEFKKNEFEEFVSRVLANKSMDLDRFRLFCARFYNMSTVGRWIDVAVRRNVKLLELRFGLINVCEEIEVPNCLVTCSSLEVLRLCLFGHRLNLPKFTGFPALRVLELKKVELRGDDLVKDFLKSCPLLEDLSLVDCETSNVDLFCISCQKLKNLRFDNRTTLDFDGFRIRIGGICDRLQICCPKLVFLELASFMANEFIFESLDSLKKVVIHPEDTYI